MTNPRQVVRVGPYKDLIASGVRVGNLLTLSGQVSIDSDGEVVGKGDICAQLKQTYQNIVEVLRQFEATPEAIMDETWFVTDIADVMANVDQLVPIREEVMSVPTCDISHTLVQVANLVEPELLIEVKCIAHL